MRWLFRVAWRVKGGEDFGDGDTDCHGQCSHWPRNDTSQEVRGSGGAHGPRPTRVFAILRRTGASAPTVWRNEDERRGGALPLPRAGKSAKRRQWRMQRAGFEEAPRLAGTTVAGNRLARRWAREPRPYESVTRSATSIGRADVGSELSAASGRGSEVSEWPRSKF